MSVGSSPGRLALLAQVGEQVVGRPRVQPGGLDARAGVVVGQRAELAHPGAHRLAELGRPPGGVALPERQPARHPRRGRHQDAVGRDVVDAPRAGAEREHVADPRLVDHLLVELADPLAAPDRPARALGVDRDVARGRAAGQEDAEQAAVGDGAAAGHREPQRAGPPAEHVAHPVPHDPGPQLRELLARVPARQHVEHRAQRRLAEPGERATRAGRRPTARRATSPPPRPSPRSAARGRRAGCAGTRMASSEPSRMRCAVTAAGTSSPRNVGNTMPRDTAPTW